MSIYIVEVREESGRWSYWNQSSRAPSAIAIAKRYAQHPDRQIRVRVDGSERVIWSTEAS